MRLTTIVNRDEIAETVRRLRTNFQRDARHFPHHSLGWQGGGGRFDVYWHDSAQLWGVMISGTELNLNRYWNAFGTDDPTRAPMLQITVEINPPHEGLDRLTAGAILRNEEGRLLLAHSGRVGGGRKGIGQKAFLEFYRTSEPVFVRDRQREMIVVSDIDHPDLVRNVAQFVRAVARFKEHVVVGARR